MSNAVVFETPGLIDVRAFTIMGAHAKPNSANPIGYFGTGLKYAIAVLVRLGAEPLVWIGLDRFGFSRNATMFRGTPLETIKMTVLKHGRKRPDTFELPYTTAYGRNWEAWQAFRELESNTRDEGGRTYVVDTMAMVPANPRYTRIIVDLPEFAQAAERIDDVFLPRGARTGTLLEVVGGESERLWYRTMRALDLQKPSIYTYNILEEMALTEDRTIKYESLARAVVARWVLSEATEDQVEAVLKADKEAWEYGLEFPAYVKPSEAFQNVMRNRRRGVSRNAWSYYGRYAGPSQRSRTEEAWSLTRAHPMPWRIEGMEILDADGSAVFAAPEDYYNGWERTAAAVLNRIKVTSRGEQS
jgi:hypothetical protein